MKLLITIFSLLFISSSILANNSGNTSNESPIIEKSNNDREGGSGIPTESMIQDSDTQEDKLIHDSDSSEYSVNKFNYLFYLIYKVKFLDVREELEPVQEEPVEILD